MKHESEMVLAPLPFEILLFPLIFIRCENTRQVKYLKGANGSLAQPVKLGYFV